jgi:hypothetical protein
MIVQTTFDEFVDVVADLIEQIGMEELSDYVDIVFNNDDTGYSGNVVIESVEDVRSLKDIIESGWIFWVSLRLNDVFRKEFCTFNNQDDIDMAEGIIERISDIIGIVEEEFVVGEDYNNDF